ncbi:MAG TPA: archaeosortase/exosortase family protein [Salinivirgaceae bacterium]|nr:archaeosortase/exosortase family protein [Salinivirgaceae bacterium]
MNQWILKLWRNLIFRYFFGLGFGVMLSVVLNDLPIFNQQLEKFVSFTNYNQWLTNLTYWQLSFLGAPVHMDNMTITINEHSFYFAHGCLGLRHLTIFAGFMMVYFGKWHHKLIYCLVGFLVLTFANMMRASLIGVALWINPGLFEPVHQYGSAVVLYGTIFLLWIIWVKREHKNKLATESK